MTGTTIEGAGHTVTVTEQNQTYHHMDGYPPREVCGDYALTLTIEPPIEGDAYSAIRQVAEDSWRSASYRSSSVRVNYLGRQVLGTAVAQKDAQGQDNVSQVGDLVNFRFRQVREVDIASYLDRFGAAIIDLANRAPNERNIRYAPFTVGPDHNAGGRY